MSRSWRTAALLLFLLSASAPAGWLLLQPEPLAPAEWSARAAAFPDSLSIMTFNISKGGRPPAAALAAVEAAAPDILCIQELTSGLAREFEARFAEEYPHRLFQPGPTVHGIGIASRLPIQEREIVLDGMAHLPAAVAMVGLDEDRLLLACVHLMPPHGRIAGWSDAWDGWFRNRATRMEQARNILARLSGKELALILGDMNEVAGQAALTMMADAGFDDACNAGAATNASCGLSWPGAHIPWPAFVRIDHILGRGVRFSDSAVLDAGGSDHYPVATRVKPEVKSLESKASGTGD